MDSRIETRLSIARRLVVFAIGGAVFACGPIIPEACSQKDDSKPEARTNVDEPFVTLRLTVESEKAKDVESVHVQLKGKKHPLADFVKSFTKLANSIEADESKRAAITVVLTVDRNVGTGQVQQVIKVAQSAGFEKFALRAIPKPRAVVEQANHPRVELLAKSNGQLASIVLNGKNLGTGTKAFDALGKLLLADQQIKRNQPFDQIEIRADSDLIYAAVAEALSAISKLTLPNGRTSLVKKVTFAVRNSSPEVKGVVLTVKTQDKKSSAEISVGADDGLKAGQVLFVYRTDPKTKQVRLLGHVKLVSVKPDTSTGAIMPKKKAYGIKRGDNVSTRSPEKPVTTEAKTPG